MELQAGHFKGISFRCGICVDAPLLATVEFHSGADGKMPWTYVQTARRISRKKVPLARTGSVVILAQDRQLLMVTRQGRSTRNFMQTVQTNAPAHINCAQCNLVGAVSREKLVAAAKAAIKRGENTVIIPQKKTAKPILSRVYRADAPVRPSSAEYAKPF